MVQQSRYIGKEFQYTPIMFPLGTKGKVRKDMHLWPEWRALTSLENTYNKVPDDKCVGVRTGLHVDQASQKRAMLVVFDIDVDELAAKVTGGLTVKAWVKFFEDQMIYPITVVHTPSGGLHIYAMFDAPPKYIKMSTKIGIVKTLPKEVEDPVADIIFRQIDVRAVGGMVYAPPTKWKGGGEYIYDLNYPNFRWNMPKNVRLSDNTQYAWFVETYGRPQKTVEVGDNYTPPSRKTIMRWEFERILSGERVITDNKYEYYKALTQEYGACQGNPLELLDKITGQPSFDPEKFKTQVLCLMKKDPECFKRVIPLTKYMELFPDQKRTKNNERFITKEDLMSILQERLKGVQFDVEVEFFMNGNPKKSNFKWTLTHTYLAASAIRDKVGILWSAASPKDFYVPRFNETKAVWTKITIEDVHRLVRHLAAKTTLLISHKDELEVTYALKATCGTDTRSFETDVHLVACLNGCFNFKSGVFTPLHNIDKVYPKFRTMHYFSRDYISGAVCPRFKGFLQTATPQWLGLVQFFGYMFSRSTHKQTLVTIVGPTAAGKSVALDVLQHMLRSSEHVDYSTQPLNTILSNPQFGTFGIYDRQGGISTDESTTKSGINLQAIKALTGDTEISFTPKYGRPQQCRNITRWIISMNADIRARKMDSAIARRIFIVDFQHTIPEKKRIPNYIDNVFLRDPDFFDKVFSWCIMEAHKNWDKVGFDGQDIKVTLRRMTYWNNPVGDFLDNTFYEKTDDLKDHVPTSEVFRDFQEFMKTVGIDRDAGYEITRRKLTTYFEDWDIVKKQRMDKGARHYCYCRLKKKRKL